MEFFMAFRSFGGAVPSMGKFLNCIYLKTKFSNREKQFCPNLHAISFFFFNVSNTFVFHIHIKLFHLKIQMLQN